MKNIYYLYSCDTNELLYIAKSRKELDTVWDKFQDYGVTCWSEDMPAKIHNIIIERGSKK